MILSMGDSSLIYSSSIDACHCSSLRHIEALNVMQSSFGNAYLYPIERDCCCHVRLWFVHRDIKTFKLSIQVLTTIDNYSRSAGKTPFSVN